LNQTGEDRVGALGEIGVHGLNRLLENVVEKSGSIEPGDAFRSPRLA